MQIKERQAPGSNNESKTSSMLAHPVTEKSTAKPASKSNDEVMSRLDKLEHMFSKFIEAFPDPAQAGTLD